MCENNGNLTTNQGVGGSNLSGRATFFLAGRWQKSFFLFLLMTTNTPFDFWNDHSLEFLEMALKRDYQEHVHSCDGYGRKERECGDTIEFFLNGNKGTLESISYDLKGCLFSHACANTIVFMALDKSIEQAKHITAADIIRFLKTLPKEEDHCADHAVDAFRMAIDDLENRGKI